MLRDFTNHRRTGACVGIGPSSIGIAAENGFGEMKSFYH